MDVTTRVMCKILGFRNMVDVESYVKKIGHQFGDRYWGLLLRGTKYNADSTDKMLEVAAEIRRRYKID